MSKQTIYLRHPLTSVEEGAYQTFGDMVFYPNGGVRLGGKWFAYRSSIHRYRFGANLIAMRGSADLNLLQVETLGGGMLRFYYRPLFRKWYQLVEVHDPRLYFHQQRYGTLIAVGLYYLRWGIRWAVVQTVSCVALWLLFCVLFYALMIVSRYFD